MESTVSLGPPNGYDNVLIVTSQFEWVPTTRYIDYMLLEQSNSRPKLAHCCTLFYTAPTRSTHFICMQTGTTSSNVSLHSTADVPASVHTSAATVLSVLQHSQQQAGNEYQDNQGMCGYFGETSLLSTQYTRVCNVLHMQGMVHASVVSEPVRIPCHCWQVLRTKPAAATAGGRIASFQLKAL